MDKGKFNVPISTLFFGQTSSETVCKLIQIVIQNQVSHIHTRAKNHQTSQKFQAISTFRLDTCTIRRSIAAHRL